MQKFIERFAGELDNGDILQLTEDTRYKELEAWSSLLALSIIAMVNENYGVRLKGDDIRSSSTLKDLFSIITSRM